MASPNPNPRPWPARAAALVAAACAGAFLAVLVWVPDDGKVYPNEAEYQRLVEERDDAELAALNSFYEACEHYHNVESLYARQGRSDETEKSALILFSLSRGTDVEEAAWALAVDVIAPWGDAALDLALQGVRDACGPENYVEPEGGPVVLVPPPAGVLDLEPPPNVG